MMKAAVLPQVGAPLVVEEIPVPRPRSGEVLIRVRACGVCHTDLHVVNGEVKFPVPARRYTLDQADEAYRALDCGEITGRAIIVMA